MRIIPDELQYTEDHLWLKKDDEYIYMAGITYYIVDSLSDILYVDLPDIHVEVSRNERVGVLESTIDVFNIKSPVAGRIVDINRSLEDSPEIINRSPYKEGWLFKVELLSLYEVEELLDAQRYEDLVGSL